MGLTTGKGSMDVPWARWWLWLWGAVAIALIVLVFFLPFKWWGLAAAIGFGTMEGVGLLRPYDPYPPLTHVIRRYVPRWVAFTAIYGFTGAAGGVWLEFPHPARLGLLLALLGWFTSHFDVTFDHETEEKERAKRRRVLRGLSRLLFRKRAPEAESRAIPSGTGT